MSDYATIGSFGSVLAGTAYATGVEFQPYAWGQRMPTLYGFRQAESNATPPKSSWLIELRREIDEWHGDILRA